MADKEYIFTPVGILGDYPALDRVDYGTKKFPIKGGAYKCELLLDKNDPKVKELMERFDELHKDIEKAAKDFEKKQLKKGDKVEIDRNPMYTPVFDEDGEETDLIKMKFKTKHSGVNKDGEKWSRTLPLFDGKNNRIKGKLGISGGSKVVVKFSLGDIYTNSNAGAGIAKYLEAAQIVELQKFSDAGGGFGEVEGGYELSEDDLMNEQSDTEADDDNDEEDSDEAPSFAAA